MNFGGNSRRCRLVIGASVVSICLAGCATDGSPAFWSNIIASSERVDPAGPTEVEYYPSDEPLRLGLKTFERGQYGLAERYFRDAVEKMPKDATAWIGLAACYDELKRFDLADRAYGAAIRLAGETTQILNNLGYSYMLRGDVFMARKKFMEALKHAPGNPTILNNLKRLDLSSSAKNRSGLPTGGAR